MTNTVVVTQINNSVLVTQDVNDVIISSVGVQGPTGATGATGSSGVIAVTAPITNSGTSSSANIGLDTSDIALKYATPWQVKYISTHFYEARGGFRIGTSGYSQNVANLYPLFINQTITIDRLAVECTTAAASSFWRIGIYNSDTDGKPTTVLLDAGQVSTSTTGLKSITVSQVLTAGLYYIAGVMQGVFSGPNMRAYENNTGNWSPVSTTGQSTTVYTTGYNITGVSGAFPTFSGSIVGSIPCVRTQFRIA